MDHRRTFIAGNFCRQFQIDFGISGDNTNEQAVFISAQYQCFKYLGDIFSGDAALFTGTGRGTGTICRFPFDRVVPGKMIKKKRLCPAGAGIRQKFVIIPTRQ